MFGPDYDEGPNIEFLHEKDIYYWFTLVEKDYDVELRIENEDDKIIHKNQYKTYSDFIEDYKRLENKL